MSIAKNNRASKIARKKPPAVIIVTKTYVPAKDAIFPEKLKKVKEILTKAKFRPS